MSLDNDYWTSVLAEWILCDKFCMRSLIEEMRICCLLEWMKIESGSDLWVIGSLVKSFAIQSVSLSYDSTFSYFKIPNSKTPYWIFSAVLPLQSIP